MKSADSAWWDYSAPIVVFGLLTAVEGLLPTRWYPLAYAVKILAVTATLALKRAPLADLRWDPRVAVPSVGVGLFIIGMWLGIDSAVPYPHIGSRIAFDPFQIEGVSARLSFLALRLYGLILVVPVMEELFWRSFLLRFATQPDFLRLPIGTFSRGALAAMVGLSALAHPEWLVAALTSLILAFWVYRTRSVLAAAIAHAVANAGLGAYVLWTHDWKYW